LIVSLFRYPDLSEAATEAEPNVVAAAAALNLD